MAFLFSTDKINHPEACYAKVCRSDIDCLQLQKMKKNNLNKRNNNKSGTTTNNKNPSANDDQDERVCCYNGSVLQTHFQNWLIDFCLTATWLKSINIAGV